MYYTELMKEILTSKRAQDIVQQISPRYGEAYVALWIIQTIGTILDQMGVWSEDLAAQTRPQTATWALPYWEAQYGIVVDTTDPKWTIERRRQNIINKLSSRAPMSPTKLEQIISVAAGADARIEEYTGKNHFTVYLSGIKKLIDEEYVRAEISKAKPAHLIYDIVIKETIDCETENYVAVATTEYICQEIPVRTLH